MIAGISASVGTCREMIRKGKARAAREFSWIVAGQVTAALGGLVGFRLLSEHLTPDIWGGVLVWQTVALMVTQVIVGGLAAASLRFSVKAHADGELKVFFAALGSVLGGAVAIAAIIMVALSLLGWVPGLTKEWRALLLVSALGISAGVAALADGAQNAFRRRAVVALHQAAGQWLRFLLGTAAVILFFPSKEAVLAGFVVASLLVLASQCAFGLRLFRASSQPSVAVHWPMFARWCRQILVYAWPFAFWGISNWLQTSVERWVIARDLSSGDLGIYGTASQLSVQPLSMFWAALMQLLSPVVFRTADIEKNFHRARMLILVAAVCPGLLAASLFVTVTIFGRNLAGLFVGPQFREMVHYWPWMLLVGGLSGAGQILSVSGMVLHRTDLLILPRVAASSVGIVLVFILVPRVGLPGAVIAAGCSGLTLCLLNARLFRNLFDVI